MFLCDLTMMRGSSTSLDWPTHSHCGENERSNREAKTCGDTRNPIEMKKIATKILFHRIKDSEL
jgi:hypothetical protein